jgi:uncharacterized alkaline shock family protein YloU
MDSSPAQGSTTIAPEVLLTIAQLTATSVQGVSRLSHVQRTSVNRLLKPAQYREGVKIDIVDDIVNVDLYIILKNDVNVREVSRNIQHEVTRAITEMVGMIVGRIDIHIEDVDFDSASESFVS